MGLRLPAKRQIAICSNPYATVGAAARKVPIFCALPSKRSAYHAQRCGRPMAAPTGTIQQIPFICNSSWSRGPKDIQGRTGVHNALSAATRRQIPISRPVISLESASKMPSHRKMRGHFDAYAAGSTPLLSWGASENSGMLSVSSEGGVDDSGGAVVSGSVGGVVSCCVTTA